MEIGDSTLPRRHFRSHGWGQTLPIEAGSGKVSITVAAASENRPSAISPTYFWQSVWAGHSSLQGPRQSPSWSPIMSSNASFRALSARSPFEFTTMPSRTVVAHARRSLGHPSASTTQTPHAPYGARPFRKQRLGISIPAFSAAARTVVPSGTSTLTPSIVRLTFFASIARSLSCQTRLTAPNLHAPSQEPQPMHFAESIAYGERGSPEIAFTGHFRAQAPQPLHFAGSIQNFLSAAHSPAGQRRSQMWASYSSRK